MFSFLSGIYIGVELPGHILILFNLLRNCQTVFQRCCTILHSHRQCRRVSVFPRCYQHLLFPFFKIAILVGVKFSTIVVFIFISPMANDAEHLFMWLLAICISLLYVRALWKSLHILCTFLNWVVCLFLTELE